MPLCEETTLHLILYSLSDFVKHRFVDSKMPVKKEADMDTDDGEGISRKRISRRKEEGEQEAGFVFQGSRRECRSSKKGSTKGREQFCNRLVKIELDVAQALADFSRLAHLPSQKSPGDLKWSVKRKRSKLEPDKADIAIKQCIPLCESQRNEPPIYRQSLAEASQSHLSRATQVKGTCQDSTLSHGDKASPLLDCRAESPSSPLPSSKLACRTFLVRGGLASKSAFQRVVPTEAMQKPGLISVKAEMEELQLDSLFSRPPARQKLRTIEPPVSVKTELLDERDPLVGLSHKAGLADVNKPKVRLTEEDKEARRLRRIQANRESARQTIRKKQILCEELTRQAATLASENEGMKQKREILMQELYFLKGQNYNLKTQLEMGSSGNLGPGILQQLQRMPLQLASLPTWQGPSLPCMGFPSHLFGWPGMMVQAEAVNCPDSPNKNENSQEYSRKLANYHSMEFQSTALIVPGIPVSRPVSVTGIVEQKCSHRLNDISSPLPTSSPREEGSSIGASGIETLKSSGASGNVGLAMRDGQQGSEKEVGIDSLTAPATENPMQARGSLWRPTAVVPFRGDCGSGDNHSTSRASENMEHYTGLQVALPVTSGSSCTGSLGSTSMNGPGLADLYAWRMTYGTAAAEARKRRRELTRRKRFLWKASKLTV